MIISLMISVKAQKLKVVVNIVLMIQMVQGTFMEYTTLQIEKFHQKFQ
jgi:hypothetical protein